MKFTITTEDFSTKFNVCDDEGLTRYSVKNQMNSIMRKFTIYNLADNILCIVEKKFFTLRPTYYIYNKHDQLVLNVRKKLNLLRPQFIISSIIDQNKFYTIGNYFASDFYITNKYKQNSIAKVFKNNGYSIEIFHDQHDVLVLIALVIIIHLSCHSKKDE